MLCSLSASTAFLSWRVLLGVILFTALTLILPIPRTVSAHLRHVAQYTQDIHTIEPGKPVERELKGGETHRYVIALTAGQCLQIGVEQRGIDVMLMLTAPGKEPISINFSESQASREEAFLFAEQAGTGQFEIKAAAPKAPAGNYLVTTESLRLATARDRAAARGQQLLAEGNQLSEQIKAENIPVIIKSFEEAAQFYRAADLSRGEILALKAAGTASFRSGNMRKAQEFLSQALSRARAGGDQSTLAGVLNDLGLTSSRLGDQEKAIACFEESLPIRRVMGDKTGEAIALNNLGGILIGRGEVEKGIGMFERSLALRKELGDERGEARMLNNLAIEYGQFGQTPRALEMALQALSLRRKLKDKPGEATTLSHLGNVYARLGEIQKFKESHDLALRLFREVGDKLGEAAVLHNKGLALQALGERQQGFNCLMQALSLRQQMGEKAGLAATLDEIGRFYKLVGEIPRAIEYATQALQLRQTVGDKARISASLTTVGLHLYDAGEFQKALEYFQQSLKMAQAVGYKGGEASATSNIGLTLEKLDRKPEALEHYLRALALGREAADFRAQAAALINLGNLNAAFGNREQALEQFQQSITLSRGVSLKDLESKALIELARTQRELGQLAEARTHTEGAIALIESLRRNFVNPEFRAGYFGTQKQAYDLHLDLLMRLHQREPAAKHAEKAFQTAERAKARTLLESLAEARAKFRQGIEPALLERERTLQYRLENKAAEQMKLLSGKHTETQAAKFKQELSALTTEYEALQTDIRQQSPHYAALTQPKLLSPSEIRKEVVTDASTLLLEYALGEEKSFLWTISANSFNSYELPKGELIEQAAQRVYDLLTARNQIVRFETAEERQARIKKADAEFHIAAAELSRMILAPVAAELRNKRPKQLLIVADGKLQYVPFAALPAPAASVGRAGPKSEIRNLKSSVPLVANHEIVYLPSASTLGVLRRELKGRSPAPKTLAVFADPVFGADDERLPKEVRERLARERQTPAKEKTAETALAADELTRAIRDVGMGGERGGLARLPHSRGEANAILKLAPEAARFGALDFDASQEAATKPEMSQYRYVHFATHGLVDNQTPELSGLVLSQLDAEGRDRDGYLRMVEIYNLNLPAELVVLSACKTGLGKDVRGEGLISLTRGFMYAGAARVVVSLWDVNDKSTASLMGELYRGLLTRKQRPSAALRAAQLNMLTSKQWAAPYYWAAFAQHGEPR